MWALARGGAQAALTDSHRCVRHEALTRMGLRLHIQLGKGIIPAPRGLGWERVPPLRAGQHGTQLTLSCWGNVTLPQQ